MPELFNGLVNVFIGIKTIVIVSFLLLWKLLFYSTQKEIGAIHYLGTVQVLYQVFCVALKSIFKARFLQDRLQTLLGKNLERLILEIRRMTTDTPSIPNEDNLRKLPLLRLFSLGFSRKI